MYFKTPIITILLVMIPTLIVYLINLINILPIRILTFSLLIVALFPIYFLIFYIYEISALDKYVNKHLFPEAYKKGLYIEKENVVENESKK